MSSRVIRAGDKTRRAVSGRAKAGERLLDEDKGTLLYNKVSADSLRAAVGYAAVSESAVTYTLVAEMSD